MTGIKIYRKLEPLFLEQLINMDRYWFESEPSKTQLDWAEQKPWMYAILTQQEQALGYILTIPVNRFAHNALTRGDMDEDELTNKSITSFEECAAIYLAAIVSEPKAPKIITKKLVGIGEGLVLKSPKPVFGITVSKAGDSIVNELQMTQHPYNGPMQGIQGYTPKLFIQEAFQY